MNNSNTSPETSGIFIISGTKAYTLEDMKAEKVKRTATLCVSEGVCVEFNQKMSLDSAWISFNCILAGDFKVKEDFRARENLCLYGSLRAKNLCTEEGFTIVGNIKCADTVEIADNSVINGNIDCKTLKTGKNVRIYGYIRADKIEAGSNFFSNNEVTCFEFTTEQHSKLLGLNTIKYFYSQNNITLNGGNFREIYTDDKFISTSSISTNRLIVDKGATIDGNVVAKEFMRVGDNSRIIGNIKCEGYFEYGPGTVVLGKKKVKYEKALPSFTVSLL